MKSIAARLKNSILSGLPGTNVQWEMASSDRMVKMYPRVKRKDSKVAAVLMLLYPYNNQIHTFFIQRPLYDGVHSGQISFPGGKTEPSDPDITFTALREASEEAGIKADTVKVIALLTPLYIPVSDTEVTPVVGWCKTKPEFIINTGEVVHIVEADLSTLANPSTVKEKPFTVRNEQLNIRYYDYNGDVIWGATAMMLHELITIFKRDKIPFTL